MDIYFTPRYGKLYETHEKATLHQVKFENEHGKVWYIFLMREIPYELDGNVYYDITTPYGFGGPVILETTNEDLLLEDFYTHFHEYCLENRIISEFVRFHPFENIREREKFYGEVIDVGPQIIRDLKQPMEENISKSVRRNYRREWENGLRARFDTTGERLEDFLEIYYGTMNRNQAEHYYYFSPEFFERLNHDLKGHFVYTFMEIKGEIGAAALTLFGTDYAYAFLGGSTEKGYEHSANASLEIETMKWLKDKGAAYYLMGGGYKGEDGIYKFKRKFAKDSNHRYHIGKKIHEDTIYHALVEKHMAGNREIDNGFFPAYRSPHRETVVIQQEIKK